MTRHLRIASWALLAAAPAAYLACGGDDAYVSPGGASVDGSAPLDAAPGADATVADGGTDSGATAADGSSDASPADASDDADAADAAPPTGIVTITAISAITNQPEPGASIVFQDATGAVLGTATTDANGQASQTMAAGGQVTAVFGTAGAARIVTIQDVQPGDALTALDSLALADEVSIKITAPAVGVGTFVYARLGNFDLNATGSTESVSLAELGLTSNVAEVVVIEQVNGTDVASASTTFTFSPTGTNEVTFPGGWTPLAAATTVTVAGFPTGDLVDAGDGFEAALAHEDSTGAAQVPRSEFFAVENLDGGVFSTPFTPTVTGATFVQNEADDYDELDNDTKLVTLAVATRTAVGTAPPTLDFSAPLPVISSAASDAGLLGDGGVAPSVSWTSASPLTGTKGIIVQLFWGNGENSNWTVFAPPTATSVSLPSLPAALAASGPSSTTPFVDPPTVIAIDGTFLANPAAMRAAAASLHPTPSVSYGNVYAIAPTLPVDGTLKLTAYGQDSD